MRTGRIQTLPMSSLAIRGLLRGPMSTVRRGQTKEHEIRGRRTDMLQPLKMERPPS